MVTKSSATVYLNNVTSLTCIFLNAIKKYLKNSVSVKNRRITMKIKKKTTIKQQP